MSPSRRDLPLVTCLADVEPEEVDWLWKPYLPIGKLSMIEGDPGLGKSWITLAIATHVANGKGIPCIEPCEPEPVLLMSCEDGLGDTIKPRLLSLGADDTNIFAPQSLFVFDKEGVGKLSSLVLEVAPRLIIIDPLVAYMGGKIDMNRANETRQLMAELASIAETYSCAILMLRHLTKSASDKAIYRGIGSIDITGACRSVLLVGAHAHDRSKRALIQTKCNIAEMGPAQGYAIIDGKFAWTGESNLTAADLLGSEMNIGKRGAALEEAKAFLEKALLEGERPQSEIDEEAENEGISRITLNRAKKSLGVIARRQSDSGERGSGKWFWRLPDGADQGSR